MALAAIAVACLGAAGARAATLTVNTLSDSSDGSCTSTTCSLRDAINQANVDGDGDTIVFSSSLNGGVITLLGSGLPSINVNLTVTGPGANLLTVSGEGSSRVFQIGSLGSPAVTISGLTIANGKTTGAGAGIDFEAGTLTVVDCVFLNNSASSANESGGAIFAGGTMTVTGSTFSGNYASSAGGAICGETFVNRGTLTVTNSTFYGNSTGGAGGAIDGGGNSTVTNNTFVDNSASEGGAIDFEVLASITLTANNNIFSGNTASRYGAGLTGYNGDRGVVVNADHNVYYQNRTNGSEDDCDTCATNSNRVSASSNPLALPLGYNGGITETYLPQSGSAAICAGSASEASSAGLTTDQRGFTLSSSYCSNGGVDAGSVQTNYLTVTTLDDQTHSTTCLNGDTCSLRDAFNILFVDGIANGDIDFATGLTSTTSPGTITLGSALPNISGQVEIIGPGANQLTINANGSSSNHRNAFTVNSGAQALLYGLTISGGYTSGGGGVYSQGTLTVLDSAISGNTTESDGGGIENDDGALTVQDSTISGNISDGGTGAGIASEGTSATAAIVESTIFSNTDGAGGLGGGGIINEHAAMTITNSTIWDNADTSGYGGGGIYQTGTLTLANSIVAANTSTGSNPNLGGAYNDAGGNVVGGSSYDTISLVNGTGAAITLSGLQYNGVDATVKTLIPLPGSPVICAGTASNIPSGTTTDERGYPLQPTSGYCSSTEVDAGAVQTNYTSLAFAQQPSNVTKSAAMNPAPTVEAVETDTSLSTDNTDAVDVEGLTATLGLTDNDSVLDSGFTQSISGGVAVFSGLTFSAVESGDKLTASLTVTPSGFSPAKTVTGTSNGFNVIGPVTQFGITAPGSVTAGVPFSVTVTAEDSAGDAVTGYTGTVHFTTSDPNADAELPANYVFQASDDGTHTFTYGVALVTGPSQTLTATDTSTSTITGSATVAVGAAVPATQVAVSGYPATVYAGVLETGTAIIEDQYGNTETGYSGTVDVTTSENSTAVPVTITNGLGTFSLSFATASASPQSITASLSPLISVPETGITVNAAPSFVVGTASDSSIVTAGDCSSTASVNCTLRDALAAASAAGGGIVTFSPSAFTGATTITVASSLTLPAATTVLGLTSGSGATLQNLITVSGGGALSNYSVFTINSATGAELANLNIVNGYSTVYGGGIYVGSSSQLTVNECTVSGNTAGGGGGIYNLGALTVENSTISGNTATSSVDLGEGGGILSDASATSLTVIDSTISGNKAEGSFIAAGGGIASSGSTTVTGSTVVGNSVSGGAYLSEGGGIAVGNTLTLANSIVAGNSSTGTYADIEVPSPGGSLNNEGGNLAGTTSSGTSQVSAGLSPLGNYGGPTQTMLPETGSAAICAGSASAAASAGLTTDQRGVAMSLTTANASTYTGVGGYCPAGSIDTGAVQTDYALTFSGGEPPATETTGVAFNAAVALTENGLPVSGVNIAVTASAGTLMDSPVVTTSGADGRSNYSLTLTSATVLSNVTLTATMPAPPTLTATSTKFNLELPVPTVIGVSPADGINTGGTSVTITGTNFTGATAVEFGGVPATSFTVNGSTSITAISPLGTGTVNVTVEATGGTSATSAADQFTYVAPTVTSLAGSETPSATFMYSQQPTISVALTGASATALPASDFTATLDGSTALTVTAGTGTNVFNIALPATALTVGSHSIAVNFSGVLAGAAPYYAASNTTIALTVTTPNYVVNTPADDPGNALLCSPQATPGQTTTGDTCSLRDALLAAANAGAANISFDATVFSASNPAAARTITLTNGTLNIPSNTSITGATSGSGATLQNLVTVSGESSSGFPVFTVPSGVSSAAIYNLVIANGDNPAGLGGGIYNDGLLTVGNSTFYQNFASNGGGIYNALVLTVENSTFSANLTRIGDGGGINNHGMLTVKYTTFSGNNSPIGEAIDNNNGTVIVENSTVSGNSGDDGIFSNGNLTIQNSIVAGNSGGDIVGSYTGSGNAVGETVSLAALGNYGGPTQTMIPLPASPAICAGLAANIVGSTDQRGEPNTNTTYAGYSATPCVDAGAVQTNYSLQFSPQPGNATQYFAFAGNAPNVYLLESGTTFADGVDSVSIPLTLSSGPGTLTNGTASTAATGGFAAYPAMSISLPGTSDRLTANLALNPAASPAPSVSITSDTFQVSQAVTQLEFSTAPPTSLGAGANAGVVDVSELGNTPIGVSLISQASDTITLTVTGPNIYSKTYTAAAVSGVASFDLSGATLTASGAYTYTASISLSSTVTDATASEAVGAAAVASVSVVSGSGQSAAIGAAFAVPLEVKVEDQYSNPISGATVIFTAPSSGAGATFTVPAVTAADGTTSVMATANGTASAAAYTVTASIAGATASSSFSLTNTQAATTLTVAPSATALVYGQPVTVTASISPASVLASTPTGSVAFYDGATALTPASTVASAAASYAVSVPTVGSHTYAAQYSGDTNFKQSVLTNATAALVVNKAAATLIGPASPISLIYGAGGTISINVAGQYSGAGIAPPTGSVTYAIGTGAPQTAAIAAGVATLTIPATQAAASYTVAVTYNGDGNYNAATPINVTLNVTQATATIVVTPYSVTYDGAAHTATGTATGAGGANLNADLTLSATTHTAAGTYAADAWSFHDPAGNYADASGTVTDKIGQAALTVTANNATKVYGTANPAFTGTVTGQQNGDTFTERFTTTATQSSSVGTYAIVPSVTGTNLADYTQSVTDGSLTITQAASATTLAVGSTSITPGESVTLTATVADASASSTGTPTGTVSFYDGATLLNTTPAALSGGVASYSTAALAPGMTHVITASYSGDVNFTGSTSTASAATTITVAPLDFTITLPGPATFTVVPGQSISYQVRVTPDYGDYAGTVSFAVAGLPAGATATFSPASIAANGGPQTVTVTITTAPVTALLRREPPTGRKLAPIALGFLFLIGVGTLRKRGKVLRGLLCVLLLAGAGAAAITISGCGSNAGFFAQAPQNYNVTVTATAANLQHSATITLNVQ